MSYRRLPNVGFEFLTAVKITMFFWVVIDNYRIIEFLISGGGGFQPTGC
jgi:hypothetical protein